MKLRKLFFILLLSTFAIGCISSQHKEQPTQGTEVIPIDSVGSISSSEKMPMDDKIVATVEVGPLNSQIFILDYNRGTAIRLPVNRGFIGFTSEEGFIICQSRFNPGPDAGGPYNTIQVFNSNGKLIKQMSLKGCSN